MPAVRRFWRTKRRLLAALCVLSTIIALCSLFPRMADIIGLTSRTTVEWRRMTAPQCKFVCSRSVDGVCVPLDLAIFVYKKDVPTKNMTFDLQNFNPVVSIPRKNNDTGKIGVLEVEQCSLEEHFPGVELIPRQGSCAVVGNGGILNNSSCGDFIDSHDFVIRANMAELKRFEVDVGRKTNLTVFNMQLLNQYSQAIFYSLFPWQRSVRDRFFDHIRSLNKSIIWYPKLLFRNRKMEKAGRQYHTIIETLRKFDYSDIRFAFSWKSISIERAYRLSKYGTLGFDSFAAARTFCSNITLFGFYPFYKDLEGRDVKYHYYDATTYNFGGEKENHDFHVEYRMLQDLEKQGQLKLVVRDCKPRNQTLLEKKFHRSLHLT
ncbi:alpha-2,8-sialyltransferase 8B-like [Acanthaster planci]|uniref:Alpha-2,8-sialyltransferase 8B-like n=1 Tax=Acanthaster planci TaxID=133434 RepID=A0A8B7XM51_ACAPL|nr:alpha-2,8-sialyltransferase 8B-like [Acanthaster planci]